MILPLPANSDDNHDHLASLSIRVRAWIIFVNVSLSRPMDCGGSYDSIPMGAHVCTKKMVKMDQNL
jgi:hypothetical protein